MAHTPGWKNDVFISYARVDDAPLQGAPAGWVSMLVEGLKTLLARQLGRAEVLAVWRDVQLGGNEDISEILEAVRGSATLLVVLSEGYLASAWCRDEFREFLALAGERTRRVFMVERMPIAPSRRPRPLDARIGYPFWAPDRGNGTPRTLGDPVPTPAEPEYYHRLNHLAFELAAELRRMAGS